MEMKEEEEEDERNVRSLLLKLQYLLSDNDRSRLHFLFGNVVPRNIREDSSINGTLNVLESLFDRGLIDNQDLTYLIDAFRNIQRNDIAKRLQIHAEKIESNRKYCLTNLRSTNSTKEEKEKEKEEEDKICSMNIREKKEDEEKCSSREKSSNNISLKNDSLNSNENEISKQRIFFNRIENKFKRNRKSIVMNGLSLMIICGLILTISLQSKWKTKYRQCSFECDQRNIRFRFGSNDRIVLSYFHSIWTIERNYSLMMINGDQLTHINYAFASIDFQGRISFNGTYFNDQYQWNEWMKWKMKYSHVRTMISVGGDIYQERFKLIIVNNESRARFASSCLELMNKYQFDGIDLDWRNPLSDSWPNHSGNLQDKRRNFLLLLKEIRRQFDQIKNKNYLLTLATGVNPDHISQMDLSTIILYVNWINVITYDFHHYHESQTNHNAPLYSNDNERSIDDSISSYRSKLNCHSAIQLYLSSGVPSSMINMGIPLYGIGWKDVKNSKWNGYLQSASSEPPRGSWSNGGDFDFDHLKRDFIPTFERFWDNQSKVPFLFDRKKEFWISYEDIQSLKWKINYIEQENLRGIFFWEISKDRQGEMISEAFHSLIKTNHQLIKDNCNERNSNK